MPFPPGQDTLLAELRVLREKGLLRLRSLSLPALTSLSDRLGLPVDRLLQIAVDRLDGNLAEATAYTLGVVAGTKDWPAQDRRRHAARIYGVSTERFRKHHEMLLLDDLAGVLLSMLGPAGPERPVMGESIRLRHSGAVITLRRCPMETLRDLDVLVSSENVYLEMSKPFKSSLSATLRNAAALRDGSGRLVDDVLPRELREWLRDHGREGGTVTAGTVVPTSPGELGRQGIKRIYHAAVAVPSVGGNAYDVAPVAVIRAVHGVFDLAVQEGHRSVALPLMGAGRAGLQPDIAFAYVWTALQSRLGTGLAVHLVTRSEEATIAVLRGLGSAGATRIDEGG